MYRTARNWEFDGVRERLPSGASPDFRRLPAALVPEGKRTANNLTVEVLRRLAHAFLLPEPDENVRLVPKTVAQMSVVLEEGARERKG